MSERNGDRARFQKNRKRKLLHRQRVRALMVSRQQKLGTDPASRAAGLAMDAEGAPAHR